MNKNICVYTFLGTKNKHHNKHKHDAENCNKNDQATGSCIRKKQFKPTETKPAQTLTYACSNNKQPVRKSTS
jgi:hypothetical protein